MTESRLARDRVRDLLASDDLDADTQDIIDIATMLCVMTASIDDMNGCAAGINKSLWTIIDRAKAIWGRLLKEPVAEAS
jgi:hypothetical protein